MMMNLSINLTLGSPGAESVLNTAPAPEEGAVDSFSLKLADELSEQEITPPIVVEDTRAADPALIEAIAARQKLAADAEVVTAKDGRVWMDDPLAGLPPAESAVAVTESTAEDQPWLDIIEKAKSYDPAVQTNKTKGDSSAEPELLHADHALVGAEDLPQLVAAERFLWSDSAEPTSAEEPATDIKAAVPTAKNADTALNKIDDPAGTSPQKATLASEQKLMSAPEYKTVADVLTDLPEYSAAAQPENEQQSQAAAPSRQIVADEKLAPVVPDKAGITAQTAGMMTSVAGDSASPDKTVKSAPGAVAEAKTAPATELATVAVDGLSAGESDADPLTATVAKASQTETLTTVTQATTSTPVQVPQTMKSTEPEVQAAVLNELAVAAGAVPAEPVQQAGAVTQSVAPTVNSSRATASVSVDKAPAANAFAEHLKTVNQTQQQQQQQHAGTDQQNNQAQAKAAVDALLANPQLQPAASAPAFTQQLHQVPPAQSLSEHTATATALTQPLGQSAVTGAVQTAALSARPAETTTWQAPLALTEPAAAQQLKDRVMVQIQHKLQTAEVQLHPEDLGSMQIKLNLQQDQLIVQFVVQQGAAKEALEQQMPRLRELLEQQGIALTEGQVEQRQSGGQQEQRQGRSGQSAGAEPDLAAVQTVQMRVSDRMVDFYA
jgi:hypothetical protein